MKILLEILWKKKEKINSEDGKLLYYINNNHEFEFKGMFKELEESIYNSYLSFFNQKSIIMLVFEIIGLLSYL